MVLKSAIPSKMTVLNEISLWNCTSLKVAFLRNSFYIALGREVDCFIEGYFGKVSFLGEVGTVEGGFSSEGGFCITLGGEVCYFVEDYFIKVCFLGELGTVEGGVSSEDGFVSPWQRSQLLR